jgi:hypothetical protein
MNKIIKNLVNKRHITHTTQYAGIYYACRDYDPPYAISKRLHDKIILESAGNILHKKVCDCFD